MNTLGLSRGSLSKGNSSLNRSISLTIRNSMSSLKSRSTIVDNENDVRSDPLRSEVAIPAYTLFLKGIAAVNLLQGGIQVALNLYTMEDHQWKYHTWLLWFLGIESPDSTPEHIALALVCFGFGVALVLALYAYKFWNALTAEAMAAQGSVFQTITAAQRHRKCQKGIALYVVTIFFFIPMFLGLMYCMRFLPYPAQTSAVLLTGFGYLLKQLTHRITETEAHQTWYARHESMFIKTLMGRMAMLAAAQWSTKLLLDVESHECDAQELTTQFAWFLLSDAVLGNLMEMGFPLLSKLAGKRWTKYHIGYEYAEVLYRQFLVLLTMPYAPQFALVLGLNLSIEVLVDKTKLHCCTSVLPHNALYIFRVKVLVLSVLSVIVFAFVYPTNPLWGWGDCPDITALANQA